MHTHRNIPKKKKAIFVPETALIVESGRYFSLHEALGWIVFSMSPRSSRRPVAQIPPSSLGAAAPFFGKWCQMPVRAKQCQHLQ